MAACAWAETCNLFTIVFLNDFFTDGLQNIVIIVDIRALLSDKPQETEQSSEACLDLTQGNIPRISPWIYNCSLERKKTSMQQVNF